MTKHTIRKSCVTKRPEGDSSANLGRVCTASDMRGRAGWEPGGVGGPEVPLRSFGRAEEKRGQHQAWHRAGSARELSAARGGARCGMTGALWGAGAAGEAPASGRGTGTAAHLWEEPPSRRGDPSRQPGAGKQGLARPPPSWEGEQPRRGLPREIKSRTSARPRSPARGRLPERTETRTVCSPSSPQQRHSARRASAIHG